MAKIAADPPTQKWKKPRELTPQKVPHRWCCKKLKRQDVQKLGREAYFRVRCNDKVAA
jgi:hypothetical protein